MATPPKDIPRRMIPPRRYFPSGDYSAIMNQTFISKEDPVIEKIGKLAKETIEKAEPVKSVRKEYTLDTIFEMEEIMPKGKHE